MAGAMLGHREHPQPTASPPIAVPARPFDSWALLILPGAALLFIVFVLPLGLMAVRSLMDPSPANYEIFAVSSIYSRVLLHTVAIAALTTIICLVLAYPYAYAMLRAGPRLAMVLVIAMILPFWSGVLVRSYAWFVLLQDRGLINGWLMALHLIPAPYPIIRTSAAVVIGMCHILLPFVTLPIYAVMRRVDPDLLPAAAGLGASPSRVMRRVFFPLTLPGVYTGGLLVFVLSLGFYVVPALLGGPRSLMFSELIVSKVYDELNFGVGSALAVVLLVATLVALWLGNRVLGVNQTINYWSQS